MAGMFWEDDLIGGERAEDYALPDIDPEAPVDDGVEDWLDGDWTDDDFDDASFYALEAINPLDGSMYDYD